VVAATAWTTSGFHALGAAVDTGGGVGIMSRLAEGAGGGAAVELAGAARAGEDADGVTNGGAGTAREMWTGETSGTGACLACEGDVGAACAGEAVSIAPLAAAMAANACGAA
jgi:hypothetical protein